MKKRNKFYSLGLVGLTGAMLLAGCGSAKDEFVFESAKGDMTKDELIDELRVSVGDTVLKQAIGSKILLDTYDVPEDLVDARYEKLSKEFEGDGGIEAQIKSMGMTVDKFKDQLRVEEAHQMALKDMNKVSDEDIKKVYDENSKGVGTIQFMSSDEKALKEVKALLEQGKSFSEISEKVNEGDGLLSDITVIEYLAPEYLKDVFKAKKGDVLEIEVVAGTLLVQVGGEENVEYDQVKGEIENRLMYANVKSFDDVLSFLIEKHNIKLDKKYKELIKETVVDDRDINEKVEDGVKAKDEKIENSENSEKSTEDK